MARGRFRALRLRTKSPPRQIVLHSKSPRVLARSSSRSVPIEGTHHVPAGRTEEEEGFDAVRVRRHGCCGPIPYPRPWQRIGDYSLLHRWQRLGEYGGLFPRSGQRLGVYRLLPRWWRRIDDRGLLPRSWRRVGSGHGPPKHGWSRQGRGDGAILHRRISRRVSVPPFYRRRFQSVIPLKKQVGYFREYKTRLADHLVAAEARTVVADAVYAISIGTNDFIENYFAFTMGRFLEFTVGEYTDFLVGLARSFLAELYGLGARKIGFTGLGVMGCLPIERSRDLMLCIEEYNAAARAFNAKLRAMVDELGGNLPGAQFQVAEVYDFFNGILQNPSHYGFVKAAIGCCGTGLYEMGYTCSQWDALTCADANRYVFWDAVHPTERTNRIVAEYLMNTTFGHFS